jgi:Tfp pilus assembly protein PilF
MRLSGAYGVSGGRIAISARAQLVEQVLALEGDASDYDRVRALNGIGALTWAQGDYDLATHCLNSALPCSEPSVTCSGTAMTLNNLGLVAIQAADYRQAADFFEKTCRRSRFRSMIIAMLQR